MALERTGQHTHTLDTCALITLDIHRSARRWQRSCGSHTCTQCTPHAPPHGCPPAGGGRQDRVPLPRPRPPQLCSLPPAGIPRATPAPTASAPSPGRLPELRPQHPTPHPGPALPLHFRPSPHRAPSWASSSPPARIPTPQTHANTAQLLPSPSSWLRIPGKTLSWDSRGPRQALGPFPSCWP